MVEPSWPRSALALKLGSVLCIVGIGTCVHAAAKSAPLGQIMAFRAGISLLLILAYGLATAPVADMRPKRLRPHLIRGVMAAAAMFLSYAAFAALPVAQAQVLGYMAPILTLPLAALILGERLSPRVILPVTLGFVGVLLILGITLDVGPGATLGALAGLGAAAIIAMIQIWVRAMSATETTLSITMSFSVIVTVLSGTTVLMGNWVTPDASLWAWLGAAGIFGAGALVLNTEAVSRAPVSVLAPLDYAGLLVAVSVDAVIFGMMPTAFAWLGMGLITGAALIVVLWRPRRAEPSAE